MADFRMNIDVVGTSFGAVPGVIPILRPFPDFGGDTRAAYLFGKKYSDFAPEVLGRGFGWRYDWSGNSQHIEEAGAFRPDDYWILGSTATAMPMGPFSLDAFVDDPDVGVTLVAFAWSDIDAKAISLIRFNGTDYGGSFNLATQSYISLGLQPQTSSGRVVTVANDGGTAAQGTLNPMTNELGKVSMYAGHYTTLARTSISQAPGQSIRFGTPNTTSKLLGGTGRPYIGIESGTGAGLNRILAAVFIRGNRTSSELTDELRAQFGAWMGAIGSGLTIL